MLAGVRRFDWYRYVLSSGAVRITGFHRSTLEKVNAYAAG
jgi:hypothetical protein